MGFDDLREESHMQTQNHSQFDLDYVWLPDAVDDYSKSILDSQEQPIRFIAFDSSWYPANIRGIPSQSSSKAPSLLYSHNEIDQSSLAGLKDSFATATTPTDWATSAAIDSLKGFIPGSPFGSESFYGTFGDPDEFLLEEPEDDYTASRDYTVSDCYFFEERVVSPSLIDDLGFDPFNLNEPTDVRFSNESLAPPVGTLDFVELFGSKATSSGTLQDSITESNPPIQTVDAESAIELEATAKQQTEPLPAVQTAFERNPPVKTESSQSRASQTCHSREELKGATSPDPSSSSRSDIKTNNKKALESTSLELGFVPIVGNSAADGTATEAQPRQATHFVKFFLKLSEDAEKGAEVEYIQNWYSHKPKEEPATTSQPEEKRTQFWGFPIACKSSKPEGACNGSDCLLDSALCCLVPGCPYDGPEGKYGGTLMM